MAFSLLSFFFLTTAVPTVENVPTSVRDWEALWTKVLQKNVDESGRIHFEYLARDHVDLDRVVAFIAANAPSNKPNMFQGRTSELAYYINAYNALAMYGVVDAGLPTSLGGFSKFTFFYLRKFSIGGKSISLYEFENDIIRPMGEGRIHFALNCMVVSCPRLPRAAFVASDLDSQLDTATRSFIAERRNVTIDPNKRTLSLSAIFKFYTEDFLGHAPSLIAYINKYRSDKIARDFNVQFLDYDWTVNKY